MSKASEWSGTLKKRPRITIKDIGADYDSINASVMDDGRCAIQQRQGSPFCITPGQALALAKWINETFGEEDVL